MSELNKDDFYINDDGLLVFTRNYHLKRGFCCKNKCLHCPWDYAKRIGNAQKKEETKEK